MPRWGQVPYASVLVALLVLAEVQETWTLAEWLLRTDEASLDWICWQRRCEPDPPRLLYASGERVAFAGPLEALVVSPP